MIPVQSNLFIPILKALSENPCGVKIGDVYNRVLQFYPDLSEEELQETTKSPRDTRIYNHMRWARLKLVRRGFMFGNTPTGLWQLSSKGKKFLKDNLDTWKAEYSDERQARTHWRKKKGSINGLLLEHRDPKGRMASG